MKKFLSIFISFIMLFNLTAEIFAAPIQLVSKEQQRGITSTLSDAYNNNSSSAYNSGSLQNSYNNALNNLAEISNTYYDMQEMITNAITAETVETGNLEILNNAILKQEKDLAAYKERLTSYNKKVEAMGGMDNIEKQYALYQQWLDLKPEIDQRKAELENIIKTGKDESAVKEAKQELNEYKKNYYSHENEFNKFKKDFDEISEDEEYLQRKENEFEFLTKLSEKTQQESMEAKEALLAAIPEDSGLTVDSDWDAIFEAAKKEMDKLEPAIEEAKSKVERIEAAQNSAYQKYLEDKFNNEFSQTLIDYCEYMSAEAEKYQRPAEYGKVNGHNVAIEPGSVVMRADGTLVADVKGSVVWAKQKSAYLACINSSWDERKLESMHSTLTMEELGDIKYGEYLLKYSFAEGKRLSDSERKQMGAQLARKSIGMFLVDPQSGLEYFYTLFGDLNQSSKLSEYFEGDWKNKGYGMTQSVMEPNEFGDMEYTDEYQLIATTDEGEAMKLIYLYKLLAYYNTTRILTSYFYELNTLMVQIINYIAQDSENTRDIVDYLESIGISLSKDFIGVDESLINQKLEEINRTYTEEEKEGIVQNTIQKRPFDPLIFALGPSHIVDRNRTLVRERRNAVQGFDLDNSQTIRDLLFFNTLLQTNYKVYKPNLEAWNNLAYHAYEEKAMILLASMLSLGQTMNDQYKVKPQNYYNELEEDLHEYGKDMVLDIGLSMFLGGVASVTNSVKTFVKSTVRTMTKNAIKVAFKSSFKQGIKAVGKRSLALTKMGAQKSIKNIGKALKGSFGSTDINALRKANSSILNSSSKANVQAFRQLKFKSPIKGTSHTLGREQGTVVTNTISNIKSQYGIRAPKTSKVFNADLTKQQVAKLSTDLDDFYKMQKSNSVATSKKGGFALSKKANSIPADVSKTQEAFKQNVKAVQKDMCGGHFRAAACTIVPMPQGVMDVLMGKANLKQLFNRNPYTNSLFNKSVNRTMKAIEKQGLDPAQADKFFVEEFSGRVNASPFMPKGRKQSLIKQVSSSMGVKPEEGNLLDNLVHAERHSSNPDKVIVYHEDNLGNVTAKEVPMKDFREATKGLSYDQKLAIKTRGNRLNNEVAQARLINKQRRVNEIDVELNNLSKSADGTNINRVRELQNEQKGLQLDIERGVIDLSNKGGGNIKSIKDKINSSAKLVKNTSEKTYTLGGDPNKVLIPVEDVSAKAGNTVENATTATHLSSKDHRLRAVWKLEDSSGNTIGFAKVGSVDEVSRTKLVEDILDGDKVTKGGIRQRYKNIEVEYPKIMTEDFAQLPQSSQQAINTDLKELKSAKSFRNAETRLQQGFVTSPVDAKGVNLGDLQIQQLEWEWEGFRGSEVERQAIKDKKTRRYFLQQLDYQPVSKAEMDEVESLVKDLNNAGFHHNDLEHNMFLKRDPKTRKLKVTLLDFESEAGVPDAKIVESWKQNLGKYDLITDKSVPTKTVNKIRKEEEKAAKAEIEAIENAKKEEARVRQLAEQKRQAEAKKFNEMIEEELKSFEQSLTKKPVEDVSAKTPATKAAKGIPQGTMPRSKYVSPLQEQPGGGSIFERYEGSSSSTGMRNKNKPFLNNPAHSAGLHGDVGRLDNIAQNMAGKSGKIPEGKVPTQPTNKPATTNKAVNTEEPTYTLGGNPPAKTTPSNVVTEDKGFFGNLKDRFNKFFKKEPTYEFGGDTPKTKSPAKPQNNDMIVMEVVEDTPANATTPKTPAKTASGKNSMQVMEVVEDTPANAVTPKTPAQTGKPGAVNTSNKIAREVNKTQETSVAKPVEKTSAENVSATSNKQPRNLLEGKTASTPAETTPSKPSATSARTDSAATKTQNSVAIQAEKNRLYKAGFSKEDIAKLGKRGLLKDTNAGKVESLLNKGFSRYDIMGLEGHGLLTEGNISKIENLINKGFSSKDIMTLFADQQLEKYGLDKIETLLQKGFSKDDILTLTKHLVFDNDLNYLDKFLEAGFSNSDILYLNRRNLLLGIRCDNIYTLVSKKGFSSKDIITLVSDRGLNAGNLENLSGLISKNFTRDDIMLLSKNGLFTIEGKLDKIEKLLSKNFSKSDIMTLDKGGLLEGKNFSAIESKLNDGLSSKTVMELNSKGDLLPKVGENHGKLSARGFSNEETRLLQSQKCKSTRHIESIEYLMDHGFSKEDILYLAKRGTFSNELNLARREHLVYKGFTRDDIMSLEKNGLFTEGKFGRIETLLKKNFSADDIMLLEKDGFLGKYEFNDVEYLLNKNVHRDIIMNLEKKGSLKTAKKYY